MHRSQAQQQQGQQQQEGNGSLLDLDEAALCAVLSWLSASDLCTAASVCSALHRASQANLLWLQLVQQDFGIVVSSTAEVQPAAARQLYRQLSAGSSRPRALACRAVCTDGGCDDPSSSTFWADNLFRYTPSDLYCSDAATANVHVLGRLTPLPSTAGQRQEAPLPELGQTAEDLRGFILQRCMRPARELVAREVVAAVAAATAAAAAAAAAGGGPAGGSGSPGNSTRTPEQEQQAAGSSSGSNGGVLGGLAALGRRVLGVGGLSGTRHQEQRQAAAAAALASCSTQGLCDFFAEAYSARQTGQAWAAGLFSGLATDADIHKMHMLMFALWSESVHSRNRPLKLRRWPLPHPPRALPPPAAAAAAATAAAGAAGQTAHPQQQQQGEQRAAAGHHHQQQQQQQQPRQLLCDVDQLLLLLREGSLLESSCLVQELLIARGRNSTCPVTSGLVFFGCQQQQQQQQLAAAAAAAEDEEEGAAASRQIGHLLQQPWVGAGQGLASAAAVFAAAEAGLLPPVLDYAAGPAAEWIEFGRPSSAELQQQQQQQQQQGVSGGGGAAGGGGGLGGVVLFPAVWFRFKPGQLQVVDEDAMLEAAEAEFEAQAQAEALLADGLPAEFESEGEAEAESESEAEAESEGEAEGEAEAEFESEGEAEEQQQVLEVQPEPAAAAAAAPAQPAPQQQQQQQQQQGSGADAYSTPPPEAAAGADAAAAAAAAAAGPIPCAAAPFPACTPNPSLPTSCPEVSAALGWYPSHPQQQQQQPQAASLAIRLRLPRLAQLLCVLLVDSEDCSPEFNASRGGCNIDCEMVMPRGQDLAVGLQAAGLRLCGAACRGG